MKKIVGYTTGCFDMFHIGHLNLLRAAKEKCDYLIAGVNTDELVLSYKNKIPVIPFEERIKIVEAIEFVDKAVPVTERDKFAAWQKYKFDVCFVGDDWKGSEIFNETEKKLALVGVRMEYLPYTKGISSTILRKKINGDCMKNYTRGGVNGDGAT